ncbi:NUMOD4 motif-containing HNH endonuclease [Heyndrickxia sporothermodurans]|uniref:NUMOD4 domain-containing protein n=1 Tax=Heyndrickxia sporothermodurans TaxID=46224 RepID=UPI002DBB6387|nr:NUMOD4 domain-containing protein [Heyndrickxia sporothermodurans]MEB6549119.1 NUMOD4 motif-containing HNH endonuclease [Heyndrickxia sporothermodurans]
MNMNAVHTLEMTRQEWRDVPNFEGLYRVSDKGEIYSIPRNGTKGGILKQHVDRYGYKKVVLYKKDKPHYFTVHRIVALAFVDNPTKEKTVNHIDGNKKNNFANNLEWVSNIENLNHSFDNKLQKIPKQPIVARRLSDGKLLRFSSQREAGRKLGLWQRSIWRAMNQSKPLHGYLFKRECDFVGNGN